MASGLASINSTASKERLDTVNPIGSESPYFFANGDVAPDNYSHYLERFSAGQVEVREEVQICRLEHSNHIRSLMIPPRRCIRRIVLVDFDPYETYNLIINGCNIMSSHVISKEPEPRQLGFDFDPRRLTSQNIDLEIWQAVCNSSKIDTTYLDFGKIDRAEIAFNRKKFIVDGDFIQPNFTLQIDYIERLTTGTGFTEKTELLTLRPNQTFATVFTNDLISRLSLFQHGADSRPLEAQVFIDDQLYPELLQSSQGQLTPLRFSTQLLDNHSQLDRQILSPDQYNSSLNMASGRGGDPILVFNRPLGPATKVEVCVHHYRFYDQNGYPLSYDWLQRHRQLIHGC